VTELGYKYHMNDIIAAIGLAQFEKLEWMNDRRRYWSQRYQDAFKDKPAIICPIIKDYMYPACHNFVIKVSNRDQIRKALMEIGITSGVHYYPNHLFEMYKPYYRELPISESIWKTLVTLPLFPAMSEAEFGKIVDCVNTSL